MIGTYINSHKKTITGKSIVVKNKAVLRIHGESLHVSLETITPDKAQEYLKCSAGNRPPRYKSIARYAKSMNQNQWHLTGQPIIFNQDNVLIDGHHRLMACVEANAEFKSLVVRNVNKTALTSIDIGGKRTVGDQLCFVDKNKYTSSNAIATVYRRIYSYMNRQLKINISEQELVEFIEQSKGSFCDTKLYKAAVKQHFNGSTIAAAAFILKNANAPKTDEFFHRLINGDMLTIGDAIHTLRSRLLLHRRLHTDDYNWVTSSIIRAYNYWIANKPMEKIHLLAQTYTDPKF